MCIRDRGLGDIGGDYARKVHALGAHVIGVRRTNRNKPDYLDAVSYTHLQNTVRASADSLDAAAKDSIKGSLNVLDKSLSVLDSTSSMRKAGRTMKDTMDNEWNDMEDDNNFLNMDPNAEKVSFTSDENAEPLSLIHI